MHEGQGNLNEDVEATIGFWGKIWVFLTNFVKYLRYMQVKLNTFVSNI